jgi:predicted dehydrogenase/threonine dehydrogenase-like Zn-dependent dehydrogenase
MKQVLQNLSSGSTTLEEVPCPRVRPGHVLIRTSVSLISAGTERMLIDFGKANLLDKARQQPDKVRMVIDKIRTDGLLPTLDAVRNKLDQPVAIGYCNVGVVIDVGAGVSDFKIGDRVASNGKHAEVAVVPRNLCALLPDAVSDEHAAFTVIGAIALQGIRLVQPTLGEAVVVTGLGLIGLVTVQLLRAHGCRVLGVDFDPAKLALARELGAETCDLSAGQDPVAAGLAFSRGRGVDAVLITAATQSDEPMHQAALMSRKRGRIVLVGVTGLKLSRADFFEKELMFQVSCSYGPGRYDPAYEERGQDYPFGFVRWTEQRNFEAVLDMMADGRFDPSPLVSHRFELNNVENAYRIVGGSEPSLGILLLYPTAAEKPERELRTRTISIAAVKQPVRDGRVVVAAIGSGNYALQVLLPAFHATRARLKIVVSSAGVSGVHAGKKFGFESASTDAAAALADPEVNTIVVTTQHDSHARFVCDALRAGKHVFVEKPLALTRDELEQIQSVRAALDPNPPMLMVGFNRRFAPHVQKMKTLLDGVREPKSFIMTVNAGAIPASHWTQDRSIGGGRIIGEGCHFIDLLRHLAGYPIVGMQATMIGAGPEIRDDKVSFMLNFADGSLGVVHYLANGHKSFPKERLEAFCAGRILQLDNFRALRGFGWPGFSKSKLWRQDKGNKACAAAFVDAIRDGGQAPIPFEELVEVTQTSFDIVDALHSVRRDS